MVLALGHIRRGHGYPDSTSATFAVRPDVAQTAASAYASAIDPALLALADKLCNERSLTVGEYERLITERTPALAALLAARAQAAAQEVFGRAIFIRGLIEFTNICKNNCYYCGIRAGNASCERYRLTEEEILSCAHQGYELGFRTFVLQGGEDPHYSDERLCPLVSNIKRAHPDCAITLSAGEKSRESYQRLFDAGADRYLLRHESADPTLYARLHPASMSFKDRMRCLRDLKDIGYAVGCGFIVGAPFQTAAHMATDLKFIEEFQPDMCGIGPFVPHHATPFANEAPGTAELTCYALSIIRLIQPTLLLPATTALGTIDSEGRERGVLSGANVVMPNLSPVAVRKNYELYDDKISTGEEAAEYLDQLAARMLRIGYRVVVDRGDPPGKKQS